MQLPRSAGDRIFQGVVALPMALLFAAFLLGTLLGWKAEGWGEQLLKFVVLDLLFLFFFVFFGLLVWCVFTPAWIEQVLARRAKQVMIFSAILIVGLVLALVFAETRNAFGR